MKLKNIQLLVLMTIVGILVFAFPAPVSATSPDDGRTIFGESYTLDSGEILDGSLTVFGGVVTIESGAVVSGDVASFGSVINLNGTVEGNLSMYGGTLTLEDTAVIEGNLTSASAYIDQSAGAVIEGDIIQGVNIPWTELNLTNVPVPQYIPAARSGISLFFTSVAEFLGLLLASVALGALLILIIPKNLDVMTQALNAKPWEDFGLWRADNGCHAGRRCPSFPDDLHDPGGCAGGFSLPSCSACGLARSRCSAWQIDRNRNIQDLVAPRPDRCSGQRRTLHPCQGLGCNPLSGRNTGHHHRTIRAGYGRCNTLWHQSLSPGAKRKPN